MTRSVFRWLLVAAAVIPLGCSSRIRGHVDVGTPKVFTRERLLRDRDEDLDWLQSRLGAYQPTVQGYRDLRVFTGFYNELEATYQPLQGTLEEREAGATLESIRRGQERAELDHRIRSLDASIRLKELEDKLAAGGPSTYTPAPDAAQADPATTQKLSALEREVAALKEKVGSPAAGSVLGLSPDQLTATKPPSAKEVVESKAQLSSLERFHDEQAYRSAVRAVMRDTRLDDVHDYSGRTYYDLCFDLTLRPGQNGRRFALVELEMEGPLGSTANPAPGDAGKLSADPDFRALYNRWVHSLDSEAAQETKALQLEIQRQEPVAPDVAERTSKVLSSVLAQRGVTGQAFLDQRSKLTSYLEQHLTPRRAPTLALPEAESLSQAVAEATRIRFSQIFSDGGVAFVRFGPVFRDRQGHYVFRVTVGDDGARTALAKFLLDNRSSSTFYVAQVDPKEQAQNVSEVAAQETLLNLVASLQASLGTGVSIEEHAQFLRRSQTFLHAIERQPLAVGHRGPRNFGWLLGPRFTIDGTEVDYVHLPVRHSFNVSVVIPAWWTSVKLSGTRAWIDSKGKPEDSEKIWKGEAEVVSLPGDLRALSDFVFQLKSHERREPQIERLRASGPIWHLQAGKEPQTLLIRGLQLWRNPEVFVGNQKAKTVSILPDMDGLYAVFEGLKVPPSAGPGDAGLVSLTVVTSVGADRVDGAVKILSPPQEPASIAAFVAVRSRYVTIGGLQPGEGALWFDITRPEAFPRQRHSLKVVVNGVALKAVPTETDKNLLRVSLAELKADSSFADVDLLNVELLLKPSEADPETPIARGKVTLFKEDAHRKLTLITAGLNYTGTGDAVTSNPPLLELQASRLDAFLHAFPQLAGTPKLHLSQIGADRHFDLEMRMLPDGSGRFLARYDGSQLRATPGATDTQYKWLGKVVFGETHLPMKSELTVTTAKKP